MAGEGQHTRFGAAPRSLSELRRALFNAEQEGNEALVSALRAKISEAADKATSQEGGKRGDR